MSCWVKLFVHAGLVGKMLPCGECSSANTQIRSPAAVVVIDAELVTVPWLLAIVDEFDASNGLAATPEYSHTDSTMSSDTDGVAVIVDSVPAAIFHQTYAPLPSTTDGPAVKPDVVIVTVASEFALATSRFPAVGVDQPSPDPIEIELAAAPLILRWTAAIATVRPSRS